MNAQEDLAIEDEEIAVLEEVIEIQEEAEEALGSAINKHCTKIERSIAKGKNKGKMAPHFKCNYCIRAFVGPSNSSFTTHLKREHPKACSELFTSTKVKAKKNFFNPVKMQGPYNADVMMGKLIKLIVRSDLSFSIVDNEDFEDFVNYLKRGNVIDSGLESRRTIMRRVEEMYVQKKQELKDKLNSFTSKYSITCDVWTSKNQLSFFGFTIHFINDDWQMEENMLAFKYFKGEHDGLTLSNALIEVLEEYEIADRLLGLTADNASNNTKMMAHVEVYYKENYPDAGFSVAWNQVECMAHVVNLAAQQILKEFKQPIECETFESGSDSSDRMVSAISRLAFLCRKIRLSPKLRRLMENICQQKKVKYLVPIIDVSTRWNSTFDMLVRALEIKDLMSDTFYQFKDKELINLLLDDDDWMSVEMLIEVLKPLKEATLLASKNGESLMVTNMLPIYHFCAEMLTESLNKFNQSDDIYIGIVAAIEKLNHYYDKISPMVGIALILDPSMKKEFLTNVLDWEAGWVETVTRHFTSSFNFYCNKSNFQKSTIDISSSKSESLFSNFKRRKTSNIIMPDTAKEYIRYFNAPLAEDGTNALKYWQAHHFDFSILAAMAKDYLTIQASSVPSERAFSSGTDLVTADRCSLAGKTIEMTQFLKFNL